MADKIKVYSAQWCPHCRRLKSFLDENKVDYDTVNVDEDKEASKLVESINNGMRIIPTMVMPDGKSYTNPSNDELKKILEL
ncbi:NrdH-redoxin [archaeon]|jgi:thioredoxin reductase (NADPH)|nr:NrdH-redoxin [archaeon]MBT4647580.1 NrdH-redoxin [archaeon]MBT6820843.1 NrdH-redoxin [archaeon]MBT7392900.1 NrdH-redoxin [archaeon]